MHTAHDTVPLAAARAMFMHGQGLRSDPDAAAATPGALLKLVRRLGFVQLDSICVVERAHHHILWTRAHAHRPAAGALDRLQRTGRLFEGWTHDASLIPSELFPHWRHRFEARRRAPGAWLRSRLGPEHERVTATVLERIRREGPLLARDFEHAGGRGGAWWDWKPAKAALEFWWRVGELAIPRRVGVGGGPGFEKVYDLTERVLPKVHAEPATPLDDHVEWACRSALDRLGVATPRELAAFWGAVTVAQAAAWCRAAASGGELVPVRVEGVPASPARAAFAPCDWRARAADAGEAPPGMRLLSPFDPLIRDRARCLRLFGFDYRFEAFVPAPKRRYGYYVLPILEGDRLVGRVDPKLDREAGTLRVASVWWERGVRPTRARVLELDAALHRFGAFVGAARVERAAGRAG